MATKKKPFSRIANAKELRKEEFSHKRLLDTFKKKNVEIADWQLRLIEEDHQITEREIRLRDWLWVKETEDSPALYSPEAQKLTGEYRQLLVRQHKVLAEYKKILDKRCGFIAVSTKPANADHRKQRGRTAPNAKEAKR